MSEKRVIDEEVQSADAVSLVLALRHLLESASIALPETKPGVELALKGRGVLHKMIASKISHGYQCEFVTTGGESYFGFIIGLDSECIQIWATGYGREFRDSGSYEDLIESFDVKPVRHWLLLNNIEAISENFLAIRHLTKKSQDELNSERRAMLRISERYLNPYSRSSN